MLYVFGAYVLDPQRRELRRADVPVGLERKVFQMLLHLVEHRDRLVTKEELLEQFWPGVFVEEGAVARCVFAARRAVGDGRDQQRVIKTVHGQGYRFVAPVTVRAAATGTEKAARVADPDAQPPAPVPAPAAAAGLGRKAATVLTGVVATRPAAPFDLDREQELAERIAAEVGDAVRPYDGVIQRLASDGFTVVFGVPRAQEDHARRAVLAALAVQRRWPLIGTAPIALGLHTSVVAVVDPGDAAPGTLVVVGEAPRLASEIARRAGAGTVVLSDAVHRLVSGFFESAPLGPDTAPVACHRLLRETEAQSRFDVALRSGLTRLVGRDDELDTLQRAWTHAKAGDGRVVLVGGEAGIGKTRLVRELTERVANEAGRLMTFACSPYHAQSALHPVVAGLCSALGFTDDDTQAAKLDRLAEALAELRLPLEEPLPLLAALLSLPHPTDMPPLAMSPQKRRERTQHALASWLLAETARGPVCCVWEDLHWADPSSLDFLGLCIDHVPRARLLFVLTFRPEFTPPWSGRSYVRGLTLPRLDAGQTEEMVGRVTGGRPLPADVLRQLVARTDGVPLFIEELTKAVVDSGVVRAVDDRYELAGVLPSDGIPVTLRDTLLARLDRLDAAKDVAQVAAVVGREFSLALLAAVAGGDPERRERALRQLVGAELVYPRGLPHDGAYAFKHALVQEVAYQSLPIARRRALHAGIAEALERGITGLAETYPEVVAQHFTAAQHADRAIPWWQRAGARATERSAHTEAVAHFRTALDLLVTLPEGPEQTRCELALQLALGTPLMMTRGYAAPEVEAVFNRARALCQHVGETPQLFPVLWGLWAFFLTRGDNGQALALARQLLGLADGVEQPLFSLHAHYALGASLFWRGESAAAHTNLGEAIALSEAMPDTTSPFRAAGDPTVACLAYDSLALWCLGYPDRALQQSARSLALADRTGHAFSRAYALAFAAGLHQLRLEADAVIERADRGIALSADQGFLHWHGMASVLRAWAVAERDAADVTGMEHGLQAIRRSGSELGWSYYQALLADLYGRTRQWDLAFGALDVGNALAHKNGEGWWTAELERVRGTLLLASGGGRGARTAARAAEERFHVALATARRHEARALELRTAVALARLWAAQKKRPEARELLGATAGWFTEGLETRDLREARALLATLA